MKRKVIQIADSTQLISLPRKWAVKNSVKKGDELDISEANNQLIVAIPSLTIREKKLDLFIENKSKFLRRLLFSPYIQGYTEITVKYNDSKVFDLISNELQLLMGYEIITQGSNYCVIKSVATALDSDLDNIINRIFLSTKTMMMDMIDAFKSMDKTKLDNLTHLEVTNNKLSYFCLRILNRDKYKDENKTNSIYYTILCIEEIVDDLRDICDHALEEELIVEKTTIEILKKILDYFGLVYSLFTNFDNTKLFEVKKGVKEINNDIISALRKPRKDIIVLSYLQSIINKTAHITKEIHY